MHLLQKVQLIFISANDGHTETGIAQSKPSLSPLSCPLPKPSGVVDEGISMTSNGKRDRRVWSTVSISEASVSRDITRGTCGDSVPVPYRVRLMLQTSLSRLQYF
jgi:hypothetical protein